MQAEAYVRAKELLDARSSLIARALGVCEALLILLLLILAALFAALLASRGQVVIARDAVEKLPSWTVGRQVGETDDFVEYADSGVFPLIGANLDSPNPVHRAGARILNGLTGLLPPLRNNVGALATILAAGLALLLLLALMHQGRRSVVASAVADLATHLRNQIHRQMYRLGQSSLPTEGVGPVVNIWTREVNDIRDALIADFDVIPGMLVLGAGLGIIALSTSPILTLFLASLGLLVFLLSRVMNRDARTAHDVALRDASVQLCLLHEDLGLLRTVRTYGVEDYDRQRFDHHLESYRNADVRRMLTHGRLTTASALLYGAAAVTALGLLGYNVLVKDRISIASMLALVAALGALAVPILLWVSMRLSIRHANRSAAEIFEFLARSPELHQNVGAEFLPALRDSIVLDDVTLESRSGRLLLDHVSMDVPAGGRTAVVGVDDDSKLALACLIPRLIDPQGGRVLIDGRDLREMTLESVRAQSATVLQADLVFTDSILVNIGLGDPRNTLQRVIEAAKTAHAHFFIQDLPHGYDTVIGPLGHYLRPDEQFRIALARAYLHDPSILIVEELPGPVDDEVKLLLDDTLTRLSIGRTVIVIPHRLSTIRSADNVVLLHNGRVEAMGTPARLQAESKLFRHILYTEFNEYATGEIEAGQVSACPASILSPASEEVVDPRRDHQLRDAGPGVEFHQELHRRRDVLGLEDRRLALRGHRDGPGVEDRGVHLARIDHRRADPLLAGLAAEAEPERRLAELGRGVPRPAERAGPQARDRADLDDEAVLPRPHPREDGPHEVVGACQVRPDHQVPVLRREDREGTVADVRARVADQDVDGAEGGLHAPGHLRHGLDVGDVAGGDQGPVVVDAQQLLRGLELASISSHQGDFQPHRREGLRHAPPDPAPRARDDRSLRLPAHR